MIYFLKWCSPNVVCLWQKTCSPCHIVTHTELLWSHRRSVSFCVCVLWIWSVDRAWLKINTLAEVSVCVWFVGEPSQSMEQLHWDGVSVFFIQEESESSSVSMNQSVSTAAWKQWDFIHPHVVPNHKNYTLMHFTNNEH